MEQNPRPHRQPLHATAVWLLRFGEDVEAPRRLAVHLHPGTIMDRVCIALADATRGLLPSRAAEPASGR